MNLYERIAALLGWKVSDVHSFSLATIREMVRGKDAALLAEIDKVIECGAHLRMGQVERDVAAGRPKMESTLRLRRKGV